MGTMRATEDGAPLLDEMCDLALRIRRSSADGPLRVRLQDADRVIEVEWTGGPLAAGPVAAAPAVEDETEPDDGVGVNAPLVGTFYRAAEPGSSPFVEVGDKVEAGQQLGIIEAMKLMNP